MPFLETLGIRIAHFMRDYCFFWNPKGSANSFFENSSASIFLEFPGLSSMPSGD